MKPVDNNLFAFIANGARVDVHYHHCLQVVVSLDNPYDCIIEGTPETNNRGFIINQAVRHACNAPQSNVLVLKINAAGTLGRQLKSLLSGKPYIDLKELLPARLFDEILPLDHGALSRPELRGHVHAFMDKILEHTGHALSQNPIIDPRVIDALAYIETHIDQPLQLKQIAGQMYLSTDRARHLFLEQLGSPIVQYVLWQRIRRILEGVKYTGQNLATTCIQQGFTDQSHFNRIFKKLYGVSPKGFIDHSVFV